MFKQSSSLLLSFSLLIFSDLLINRLLDRTLKFLRTDFDRIESWREFSSTDRTRSGIVSGNVWPSRADLRLEASVTEDVLTFRDDSVRAIGERRGGTVFFGIVRGRIASTSCCCCCLAKLLDGSLRLDVLLLIEIVRGGLVLDGSENRSTLGAFTSSNIGEESEKLNRSRFADTVLLDVRGEVSSSGRAILRVLE